MEKKEELSGILVSGFGQIEKTLLVAAEIMAEIPVSRSRLKSPERYCLLMEINFLIDSLALGPPNFGQWIIYRPSPRR